jgi:hypothetical protein
MSTTELRDMINKRLQATDDVDFLTTPKTAIESVASFIASYREFRFRPKFGRVSGSLLPDKTEIKGIVTIHRRYASPINSSHYAT